MSRSAAVVAVVAAVLSGAGTVVAHGHAQAARKPEPKCFGAADRDPLNPCDNPRLRLTVTPTLEQAQVTPNIACVREEVDAVVEGCSVGLPADQAVETVAIIGDSHAAHWRATMASMAKAKRWRVIELGTPHCPFSQATPDSGAYVAQHCPDWNRRILAWLPKHPEIRTVFFSANARAPIIVPNGQSAYDWRVNGYVREWQLLPSTVQRIIVIRDTPVDRIRTPDCIRAALKARKPPGATCKVPRKGSLPPDAEVSAAKIEAARGAQVVDLTPFFCARVSCFPVVGGVLVHKDMDHLGQLFARTLGPYLVRAVDALHWPTAAPAPPT